MKRSDITPESVRRELFALADEEYKRFHAPLIPTVAPERIIGVRIPVLRKYSAELARDVGAAELLRILPLPHEYYDEDNLHGVLIGRLRDYDDAVRELDAFLPHVDNWATCDMLKVDVLARHRERVIHDIDRWLASDNTYEVRFAIKLLMDIFLGANYKTEYSERVLNVKSEEYYVNMMRAWYFATALAKNYDDVIGYLEEKKLDSPTHNKTIRKATDSLRISADRKIYLKSLLVKSRALVSCNTRF